jgi:hypothetical protein
MPFKIYKNMCLNRYALHSNRDELHFLPQTLNTSLIAFIGGGSIMLNNELKSIFPSEYTKFVVNPIFSNARGMKKLLVKAIKVGEQDE